MVFTPQFKCKQIKLTHVSNRNIGTYCPALFKSAGNEIICINRPFGTEQHVSINPILRLFLSFALYILY